MTALFVLAPTVLLTGCGAEKPEFSREFEKPETPAPVVVDPPDTGDDIHPRDR